MKKTSLVQAHCLPGSVTWQCYLRGSVPRCFPDGKAHSANIEVLQALHPATRPPPIPACTNIILMMETLDNVISCLPKGSALRLDLQALQSCQVINSARAPSLSSTPWLRAVTYTRTAQVCAHRDQRSKSEWPGYPVVTEIFKMKYIGYYDLRS